MITLDDIGDLAGVGAENLQARRLSSHRPLPYNVDPTATKSSSDEETRLSARSRRYFFLCTICESWLLVKATMETSWLSDPTA